MIVRKHVGDVFFNVYVSCNEKPPSILWCTNRRLSFWEQPMVLLECGRDVQLVPKTPLLCFQHHHHHHHHHSSSSSSRWYQLYRATSKSLRLIGCMLFWWCSWKKQLLHDQSISLLETSVNGSSFSSNSLVVRCKTGVIFCDNPATCEKKRRR